MFDSFLAEKHKGFFQTSLPSIFTRERTFTGILFQFPYTVIVIMSPRAYRTNGAVSTVNKTTTKQIDVCDMERTLCLLREVKSFIFPSEKDVESKMIFFPLMNLIKEAYAGVKICLQRSHTRHHRKENHHRLFLFQCANM